MNKKYRCLCCGYYTLAEDRGKYDICEIYFWEDDPVQGNDERYEGGANHISLYQARKNYRNFSACDEELLKNVKKPTIDEICFIMSKCEGKNVHIKTQNDVICGNVEVYESKYDNSDDDYTSHSICVLSGENTYLLYDTDIEDIQIVYGNIYEDKYRFAASDNGAVKIFDYDFQKELFYKYLKVNGLDEEVVLEANQDWDEVLDGLCEEDREMEMPRKLPMKYKGDIFEELYKLYKDFISMGVHSEMEIIFEDITGMDSWFSGDEEINFETVRIIKELGYDVETVEVDGEIWSVVR